MSEATKQFLLRLNAAETNLFQRATYLPPFSKGREELEQQADAVRQAREILLSVEMLRAEEGSSVTFLSDNADFNGLPACAIECNGSFTGWEDKRFTGGTLAECVRNAHAELWALRGRSDKD